MKERTVSIVTRVKMVVCLLLFTAFCTTASLQVSAAQKGFYVSGTTLYDANGNPFIMRGANYPHAWYADKYETAIPAIANKGFNTIRIVLADGEQYSKTSVSEVKKLVELCKQNELVTILEVHDATGSDSITPLNNAVNYWLELKDVLDGNENYVILNIANEWAGAWDSENWKNGYVSAIQTIRNAGIKNTIMVDSAGWGQYPQSIVDYGQTVLAADSEKNTMFSIHMYEYAGGDSSTVKNNINNVLNKNLCLVIGEFGGQHTNGDVDEDTIMSHCQDKQVGWIAWSWSGNSDELSYLDMTYDWAGNSLTSFGQRVINGTNGVTQTSSKCSIFTGSSNSGSSNSGSDNSSNDSSSSSSSSSSSTEYQQYFYGSSYAGTWGQAISESTKKNGGSIDVSDLTSNGYFYVEYTGSKDAIELIFESWSGGNSWCRMSPSETGSTSDGYYAKWSYDTIVSNYGSDFSTIDKVHVGVAEGSITAKKLMYIYNSSESSNNSSSDNNSSNNNSSNEDNSSSDASSSSGEYVQYYYGSAYANAWGQAISVMTNRNGGSINTSDITKGGYFYVEYSGTDKAIELVLQSWSGGSSWKKITPSETGYTSNGYYAQWSYDTLVSNYGSDFGTLDQVHVGATDGSITAYKLLYMK